MVKILKTKIMRLLLIHPKFPYRGKDLFPIGLGVLASIAKKKAEVFVIDENIQELNEGIIREISPELVGISATTPSFPRAVEIIKLVKKASDAKVFLGGVHVTFRPEEGLEYADLVIRGEGELTLLDILDEKPLEEIKGISFKKDGKIIHNEDRELIEDLDSLPFPAYELFPLEKYEIMSIATSRGCPYSCIYCSASEFWKHRVRFRSPENVFEELKLVKKLGFTKIRFMDSIFTLKKERVLRICELIRDMGFKWSCEIRADLIDDEILKAMKEAGCFLVCIGVDSGSQKVLDACNRRIKVEDMKKAFMLARKHGIKTRAYVTFGFPGETKETVIETIRFLEEIKPDRILLSLATAYPGTKLEEGRFVKIHPNWIKKFHGHGFGGKLYLPEGMQRKEYTKLADFMYREIKRITKNID